MTDAYVIHTGEQTAGIVVREQGGFHFFATLPALFALEGRLFSGLGELHQEIERIRRARRAASHARPVTGRRVHEPTGRAA